MRRLCARGGGLLGALLLALCGSAGAEVQATAAYREAFGAPPASEGVACRAAVVFLPGVGRTGREDRLAPVPLFSVTPDKTLEEAARVLVEGHPVEPRFLTIPRLFPPGTSLAALELADGLATVRLGRGLPGDAHPLAGQALAHTLTQFAEVERVRVQGGSAPPGEPLRPDPAVLEAPASPRLLDVVASAHAGEPPEEVDVLFDRPVEVVQVEARRPGEGPLAGRWYTSMFDMAAVLRPEDPSVLREGMTLQVTWAVRDRKGREARGSREVSLRFYVHPEPR
ncbi:MAG: hypothetical protein Kow0092_37990 [Deferrisomatales bacterium]